MSPRAAFAAAEIPGLVRIPADRARTYREHGYWTASVLPDILDRWTGAADRHRLALSQGDDAMTYGALAETSTRIAHGLAALGIKRGDRVAVQLPNCWQFLALVFALWRIGAVPVMALLAHRRLELGHILAASGAVAMAVPSRPHRSGHLATGRELRAVHSLTALLVAGGADAEALRAGEVALERLADPAEPMRPAPDRSEPAGPDDLAMLLMSGGTTGIPKLIPRTHADYLYNVGISAEIAGVDRNTVYLASLPVAHNFALGCPGVLGALWHGGRVVLQPTNAGTVPTVMDAAGVTMSAAVPTLVAQWLDQAEEQSWRPATLRLLQVGGARLEPDAARRVRRVLGCDLQQVYGMAEGLLNFTRLDDPEELIVETQGRPASPADEIRVVDGSGRDVGTGEVGELLARGPYTIAGYYDAPDANAEAFTADGYYRTGDLVRRLATGHFIVEGRLKDVINRGGEKVVAAELETLVLGHPAVRLAAAVAMPDRVWGEAICVYVVADTVRSLTLHELRAFLNDRGIARFKLPDRLELVDALPVTAVGKVDKRKLRRRAAGLTAES